MLVQEGWRSTTEIDVHVASTREGNAISGSIGSAGVILGTGNRGDVSDLATD